MSSSDGSRDLMNRLRSGSGEPLVLLHGIGSNLRVWSPILPALERAHEVLAFDMPGFGESPPLPPTRTPSVPALADAVEEALDAEDIAEPHLGGNSLGGWVALELARRGRARSVVAFSPAGMGTRREVGYASRSLALQRAIAERLAPHASTLTRTAAGRTVLFSQVMSRAWRLDPAEAASAIRNLARAPGWKETLAWASRHRAERLDEIRCPVRIAWGTRDTLLLPRQGPRFVRAIRGAELLELRGLGHIPMSDDAELVSRAILDFTAAGSRAA